MKTLTVLAMMEHSRDRHVGEKYNEIMVLEPCFDFEIVKKQGQDIKLAFEKLLKQCKEEVGDDFEIEVVIDAMPQHEVMIVAAQGQINSRENRDVIRLPEKYNVMKKTRAGKMKKEK